MTHFDPCVRLALQLFYGSAMLLLIYLRTKMKKVTIIGNNLPAFLCKTILQKNNHRCAVIEPLCEKESIYAVDRGKEKYPLLGLPFQRSSFEFFTALPDKEDIQKLASHTSFSEHQLEKELDTLIVDRDKFLEKNSKGEEWVQFSTDLRSKEEFTFSSLYHCILEDESIVDITNIYRYDISDLRYVRYPKSKYIVLYNKNRFLFLTEKVIFCMPEDPHTDEIILGDYIHQEYFTELGYHFCSGELGGYQVALVHEGRDLWIRIRSELFYVDSERGLCNIKKKAFQPQEILQYFQTPDEDLIIDPHSFSLTVPRHFTGDPGLYYLHPFHLPKSKHRWLTILLLASLIARS